MNIKLLKSHGLDPFILLPSDRADGLHVSNIYEKLYQVLDPKFHKQEEGNILYLAMGLAWERYFEEVLRNSGLVGGRPDPMVHMVGDTPLHYSPDLIIDDGGEHIGEIKLTSKTVSDDLTMPKFDKYLTQVKAYCYFTEIPRARLYILFSVGNMWSKKETDKTGPQLKVFEIEFSARELQENYRMLINFARAQRMIR